LSPVVADVEFSTSLGMRDASTAAGNNNGRSNNCIGSISNSCANRAANQATTFARPATAKNH